MITFLFLCASVCVVGIASTLLCNVLEMYTACQMTCSYLRPCLSCRSEYMRLNSFFLHFIFMMFYFIFYCHHLHPLSTNMIN